MTAVLIVIAVITGSAATVLHRSRVFGSLATSLLAITALPAHRPWFVTALVVSALADLVRQHELHIAGLIGFALAYFVFSYGLVPDATKEPVALLGIAGVVILAGVLGGRIIIAARGFRFAATLFVLSVGLLASVAGTTLDSVLAAGALLLFLSHGAGAWNTFVDPLPWAPPASRAAYHAGQILLVVSLTT